MDVIELEQMLERFADELSAVDREYDRLTARRQGLVQTVEGLRRQIAAIKPVIETNSPNQAGSAVHAQMGSGKSHTALYKVAANGERLLEPLRGKDAARYIFTENPNRVFTVAELLEELEKINSAPKSDRPESVLRVTVARLMEEDPNLKRVGYGRYAYEPEKEEIDAR